MTGLMTRHSIIALGNGIFELILVFYAIIMGLNITVVEMGKHIFMSYIYFTMISNTVAALAVAFVIPYAVEGIRKKRFILPHWISILFFVAVNSISVVMVIIMAFMSWADPERAYGGPGLFTHLICPLLVIVSFFQIESGYKYKLRDCLMACVPFTIYVIVYFIMVVIIGEDNGGWPDIYGITGIMPPLISSVILLVIALVTSLLISRISNFLTEKRNDKLFLYWNKDVQPVEASIEAYGLGTMMARGMGKEGAQIPYDILEELAKRYDVNLSDLLKSFVKGLEVGMEEDR